MPYRVLDLRLFWYALAPSEQGGFRRAAAALNLQRSTVSQGIRNVEHRLGARLFLADLDEPRVLFSMLQRAAVQ